MLKSRFDLKLKNGISRDNRAIWLVGLAYSYCSRLEHRASVKRLVSLQFLNLRHAVGYRGRMISLCKAFTQTQDKQTSMPRV
jgi:hypothetical protein